MGELFLDERGQALRVTWHTEPGEPGVVVLSIWRDEQCVGTVRLGRDEARRLAAVLAAADGPPAPPPRKAPARRTGTVPRRFTDPAAALGPPPEPPTP